MERVSDEPISQLIRSARRQRQLSQYALARELATVSGKPTVTRDLIARWERGHQVPRYGSRQWLSVVLQVPQERLDAAAAASRRRTRLGHAIVTHNAPVKPGPVRRAQGTPALLPVFRSRVQAGILAATLLNPERAFSLTELAEHAGASLASVDKESRLLEAAGILASRSDGTIRLMRAADCTGPIKRSLTDLIKSTYGVPQIIGEEFGRIPGVARLALGGSWAERFAGVRGRLPDSIELLVAVDQEHRANQTAIDAAARRAQRRLNCQVHVAVKPLNGRVDYVQIPRQRAGQPVVAVARVRPRHEQPSGESWDPGHESIAELLNAGQLEMVGGAAANEVPYLDAASRHIDAAEQVLEAEAPSAFLLLAHAAQLIASALLANQGLRAAVGASEDIASRAVTAQFGHQFSQVELLRRRSMELRQPVNRDSHVTDDEAKTYLATVRSLLSLAHNIIGKVGIFTG